mmetsp:Transcript_8887/g.21327  ORF Transcript_8887/g.21327 Transcript_8887/m.21327 type:complete len:263 (+) Transcript_8887:1684-2472(+)
MDGSDVKTVIVERHPRRACYARDLEVEAQIRQPLLDFPRDCSRQDSAGFDQLLHQRSPHLSSGADKSDREPRVTESQRGVGGAKRARAVRLLHHNGDLTLRRALGNRAHVHARVGHRLGEGGADARAECHALAHDGDDREAVLERDRSDLRARELALEHSVERTQRAIRIARGDDKADGGVGRGLRDHDDLYVRLKQCSKEAVVHVRQSGDPSALEVDDGDVVDRGDPADGRLVRLQLDGASRLAVLRGGLSHLPSPGLRAL